jgi:hypothetical protein
VYVANWGSGTVSRLNGTSVAGTITVGSHPGASVYSPSTLSVDVLNTASANVSEIVNGTLGATIALGGAEPASAAYDGSNGYVVVGTTSAEVAFVGATREVASVPLAAAPAGLAVDTATGTVLATLPTAGEVGRVAPSAYSVSFLETGLPASTTWGVELAGTTLSSSGTTITFTVPYGSYPFSLRPPPDYSAYPSQLSPAVLHSSNLQVGVTFHALAPHTLTFAEVGLPASTRWCLTLSTLACSNTSTIAFSGLFPGTYAYNVSVVPGYRTGAGGNVTVGSSNLTKTVRFTVVKYAVMFVAEGLAPGKWWKVTFDGVTHASNSHVVRFTVVNGTYNYTVHGLRGWGSSPSSGSVDVAGTWVSTNVTFTQTTYAVTFAESGLANATNWSVTVRGTTYWSDGGTTIVVHLPNGSYAYAIGPIVGLRASGVPHRAHVAHAPLSIAVTFRTLA